MSDTTSMKAVRFTFADGREEARQTAQRQKMGRITRHGRPQCR